MTRVSCASLVRWVGFAALTLLLAGVANAQPALNLLTTFGQGAFYDAAWSPDGDTLAVASSMGIWLYEWQDVNTEPRLLEGDFGGINRVAYSPDGSLLAAASPYINNSGARITPQITLWDAVRGTKIRSWKVTAQDIAFSPDGKWLATSSYLEVQLWNAATGELVHTFSSGKRLWDITFSPDGRLVAFGSEDGSLYLWDTTTGALAAHLVRAGMAYPQHTKTVVFSPDGHFLVAAGDNGALQVWMHGDASWTLRRIYPDISSVYDLAFSPDGTQLASASSDGIHLWSFQNGLISMTGNHLQGISDLPFFSLRVAFSPDGKMLAAAGLDGQARLWSVKDENLGYVWGERVKEWAALNPHAPLVAVSSDRSVELWDLTSGQAQRNEQFASLTRPNGGMAFSPDGVALVVGSWQNLGYAETVSSIFWWDAPFMIPAAEWFTSVGDQFILQPKLVFRPDGAALAYSFALPSSDCLSHKSVLTLWDTHTGKRLPTPELPANVIDIAFSPDSRWLAATFAGAVECPGPQNTLKVWDTATNTEHASLHYPDVSYLVFSADSTTLFGAGYDVEGSAESHIYRWATTDFHEISTDHFNDFIVTSLALSPDGKMLVLGDDRGRVHFIDTTTNNMLRVINVHLGAVTGLTFGADGTLLASTSTDGTVRVWRVDVS